MSCSTAKASISGNSVVPGLPNMTLTPSCLSRSRKARFPDITGKFLSPGHSGSRAFARETGIHNHDIRNLAMRRPCRTCRDYGFRAPRYARPRNDDDGAAEGIRTPDPRITNAVLYRLSYRGKPWKTLVFLSGAAIPKPCLLRFLLRF